MFGRLLAWYAIYTLSGALAPDRNFARCKIHFTSKSCVLVYWQRYCMSIQQRTLAKLCGVVQGMKLRNSAEGATYILQGGNHVRHRPTFLVYWCATLMLKSLKSVARIWRLSGRGLWLEPGLGWVGAKPWKVLSVFWTENFAQNLHFYNINNNSTKIYNAHM